MKRYRHYISILSILILSTSFISFFISSCNNGGGVDGILDEGKSGGDHHRPPVHFTGLPQNPTPHAFGESLFGTAWLTIPSSDIATGWHTGNTVSGNVGLFAFSSEHDVWVYTDLDLGGATHKIPTYSDPPYNSDILTELEKASSSPTLQHLYYDYSKNTHQLVIYTDSPADFDPVAHTVKYTFTFNNNPSNPALQLLGMTYYVTPNTKNQLGVPPAPPATPPAGAGTPAGTGTI